MRPGDWRAALYLRLSKEDGGGESASIAGQRAMLRAFAREQGFSVHDEYADDGYTGTNFDRPAFRRMIGDIEAGLVNLVLVKDLSRLGRDYIRAGQYTELYFPAKGVRLVAPGDGYDSLGAGSDILPFRHVVNELYARDASRKIRGALSAKMRAGAFIGSFAPYGYQKDPSDKNHLIPDPVAATVVRIFALAGEHAPAEIAELLTGEGIPSPLARRMALHPGLYGDREPPRGWSASGVRKILTNPAYLGHTVQGRTTKVSFKGGAAVYNPRENWVAVENTHTPLVTRECWEAAGRGLRRRARPARGDFHNLFSGLAFCADCGSPMSTVGTRKKGSPASLACGAYKAGGRAACTNHFIDYNALYDLVLDALGQAAPPEEREALAEDLCEDRRYEEIGHRLRAARARLGTVEGILGALYEDRAAGRLAEEDFRPLLDRYRQEGEELRREMAALGEAAPDRDADAPPSPLAPFRKLDALTPRLLDTLVERIEVGQGQYLQEEGERVRRQPIKIILRFHAPSRTDTVVR